MDTIINQEVSQSPFDLSWLSTNFNLNQDDVEFAKFDNIGVMYEIHFKNLESAKRFFDILNKAQCFPRLQNFNNTVCLNKHSKDKIVKAASIPVQSLDNSDSPKVPSPNTFFSQRPQRLNHGLHHYLHASFEELVAQINLAKNTADDDKFVHAWLCAFMQTRAKAFDTNTYLDKTSDSKCSASSIAAICYSGDRSISILQTFTEAICETKNLNRLHALFSNTTNIQDYFEQYNDSEKSILDKLMYFVHAVKNESNKYRHRYILVNVHVYWKENPYKDSNYQSPKLA